MAYSKVIKPPGTEIQLLEGMKIRDVELGKLDIAPEMQRFRASAWQRFLSMPADEKEAHLAVSGKEEVYSWEDRVIKLTDLVVQSPQSRQPVSSGQIIIQDSDYQISLDPKYSRQGVILCDLLTAQKTYFGVLRKYLEKLDIAKEHRLSVLAQAVATGGFFLYVPAGVSIEFPIIVDEMYSERVDLAINHSVIILENDASVTLAAQNRSDFMQREVVVLESRQIFQEPGASLKSMELQLLAANAMNYRFEKAYLDSSAKIEWISSQLGSKLTRGYFDFELMGEGSSASIAGIYIPGGSQRFDFHTRQDHLAANTSSTLLYKGVLLDESQTTWRGMINISNDAAKSQSYQANNNLILSDQAHIDSIPGMEILTNDVQCKHGATIGKIDPRQLFYLESRGIDSTEATRMLAEGFLDAIIQKYPEEQFKSAIRTSIQGKLSRIKTQNSL